MSDDTWTIANHRCDPHTLGQFNSVFTISNGYLGIKGNLQEDRDGYCPVTLVNGVYDELDMFSLIRASRHERPWLDPEHFDTAGKSPAIANLPDPLFVRILADDCEVSLGREVVSGFRQELDLRCGCYHYAYDHDGDGTAMHIEMWRFASLVQPHRAYMRYRVTPQSDVTLRIFSGIDARVHANMTRERQYVVERVELMRDTCRMQVRTPARQHEIHLEVENRIQGGARPTSIRGVRLGDAVYAEFEFKLRAGQAVTLDRFIALRCSEDAHHGARLPADPGTARPFVAALDEQRQAWQEIWKRADVEIDGDETAQRNLRFCLYHLLAAAPRFTDKLSVPVKLLTGDYYQGNTFFDTDLYIEPFYLFTVPELARNCLNFRHSGLTPARRIARELGCEGAKFAWQAGPYGEECLGKWYRFVHTNIHINADVVYSLMQYYWVTGDEAFLRERGIDILVESARFYASRAIYDERRDAYDIHNVAGPDEAHCRSTNNFYTNYLAIRTLRWAAETLEHLQRSAPDAARRLTLGDGEAERWRYVADHLTLLYDPQTRLYEQCDGFYRLPPPPADLLDDREDWFVPLAHYQALNQPDVLMAMDLFRDEFDEDVRRANWEYYNPKSMNFSSLSFAVNAIMAADLGKMEQAYQDFLISAGMDLDESLTGRHDTHAGLHAAALGGAWMAAVFGFGGVCLSEKGLRINPNLPSRWDGLRFNLVLRGEIVHVGIDRTEVSLRVGNERSVEIPVRVSGEELVLRSGEAYCVRRMT